MTAISTLPVPTMQLPFTSAPNEIPNDIYHHGEGYKDFISSSNLKQLLESPKWFRWCIDNPQDKRISLENALVGSVYHDMLCSIVNTGGKDGFNSTWAVFTPPVNEKTGKPYGYDTNAFTGAYNAFSEANPGKQVCSQSEIELADKMISELLEGNQHLSKDINYLIKHGKAEQSHFVEYQGGYFKFRTDLKTSRKIIDWKTCAFGVPKPENWARQVINMGYHISAAFYQFFDHQITGQWKDYLWVVQEKEPPYDFNIIDASNWAFQVINEPDGSQTVIPSAGATICIKLMEQYLICNERNLWPGYSVFTPADFQGHRIATSQVPGYELGKMIEFHND